MKEDRATNQLLRSSALGVFQEAGEETEAAMTARPGRDLESPFLSEELFVGESKEEWEPRVAALVTESPFRQAFGQRPIEFSEQQEPENTLSLEEEVPIPEEARIEVEEEVAYPPEESESDEEEPPLEEFFTEGLLRLLKPGAAIVQRVKQLLSEGAFGLSLLWRFASGQIWSEDHLALEILLHRQPRLRPAELDTASGSKRLGSLRSLAVKHQRELTPIRERIVRPIFGNPANFQVGPAGASGECQIQDLRKEVPENVEGGKRKDGTRWYKRDKKRSPRKQEKIDSIVLHHMAYNIGNDVKLYIKVGAHYIVTADGQIAQLYDDLDFLNASNGFNKRCIAIEFAGNFPDHRYHWWKSSKPPIRPIPDRCYLTPAQIRAGRCLLATLKAGLPGIKYLYAHRQSSESRPNDPGPDVWFNIGEWALAKLNLTDQQPTTHIGTGRPIPSDWRTARPALLEKEADSEHSTDEADQMVEEDLFAGPSQSATRLLEGPYAEEEEFSFGEGKEDEAAGEDIEFLEEELGGSSTYFRIANDIVGAFEGGKAGKLNLKDQGIISYGKHQATLAGGALFSILKRYTELSKGETAARLASYLDRVKKKDESLSRDQVFIQLLKDAARDPEMSQAQDEIFAKEYWVPAKKAAAAAGVTSALGHVLFYDAHVHSGAKGARRAIERTINHLGGKVGAVVGGSRIDELAFLRAFHDLRIKNRLRRSAKQAEEAKQIEAEAQALEREAATAEPERKRTLLRLAEEKRRKAKRKAANSRALEISAKKTRGPTYRALVESGDLELRGDAAGQIRLVGKPGVKIRGLQPGATVDEVASELEAKEPGEESEETLEESFSNYLGQPEEEEASEAKLSYADEEPLTLEEDDSLPRPLGKLTEAELPETEGEPDEEFDSEFGEEVEADFWADGKRRLHTVREIHHVFEGVFDAELSRTQIRKAVRLNRGYAKTLYRDDKGNKIDRRRIGRFLAQATGLMPPVTEEGFAVAVARWQRTHGLKEDGILGPVMWKRLQEPMGDKVFKGDVIEGSGKEVVRWRSAFYEIHQKLLSAVDTYWTNYIGGLNELRFGIIFASSGLSRKSVLDTLLDLAFSIVEATIPFGKFVTKAGERIFSLNFLSFTKEAIDAVRQNVSETQGGSDISDYASSIIQAVEGTPGAPERTPGAREVMKKEALAAMDRWIPMVRHAPDPGAVVEKIRESVDNFFDHVGTLTSAVFALRFGEGFVQKAGPLGAGERQGGILYLPLSIEIDDTGVSLKSIGKKWILATTAKPADKLAEALFNQLQKLKLKVWQLNLLKSVDMTITRLSPTWLGFPPPERLQASVIFRTGTKGIEAFDIFQYSRDSFQYSGGWFKVLLTKDHETILNVWNAPLIRKAITGVNAIRGTNSYNDF